MPRPYVQERIEMATLSSDAFVFFGATGGLLGDALRGDNSLFTSDASVEAAWRVVDPILDHPAPLAEYECGTWPAAAQAMAAGVTGWRDTKARDNPS